jgi:glucoamylase
MYDLYMKNLNINGTGAVVAAPDKNTPGGSYYYHWMRDGALSMDVYMDLNDMKVATISDTMNAYVKWVKGTQSQQDDNNDVRIEPKFEIPSGKPYTGGWCRPQTDGPGLRARTLSHYGSALVKAGSTDQATNDVWPLVKNDLEWVTANWQQNGCDLWEEARNTDFFWGRMGYVNALRAAADFATSVGEDDSA